MADRNENLEAGEGEKVLCSLCGAFDKLMKCARCRRAYYCSKEHQKKHWKEHKLTCNVASDNKIFESVTEANINSQKTCGDGSSRNLKQLSSGVQDDLRKLQENETVREKQLFTASPYFENDISHVKDKKCNFEIKQIRTKCDKITSERWLTSMCNILIRDLNNHGICVVDNFLGSDCAEAVLGDVCKMHESGSFEAGKLVKEIQDHSSENIRGDYIKWVNGTESNCKNIGILVNLLDTVVTRANKFQNNGKLGDYNLGTRTKAMLACYPGSGTHYVKHVDNPNGDGRCLTSLYYLNKDWDVKRDGGLLRVFPRGNNDRVANIEPKFDRVLFMWSDRRNPHEVLPTYRARFAITVWYLDSNELQSNPGRMFDSDQMKTSGKSKS